MLLGLGLMEGLGSALLRRPSIEPEELLARWLLLKGWQMPGCLSACGADLLTSCSRALIAQRCGDS